VNAVLSLSHRGVVPGETVHINAEVSNQSRRKMAASSVQLMMVTASSNSSNSLTLTYKNYHVFLQIARSNALIGPENDRTWFSHLLETTNNRPLWRRIGASFALRYPRWLTKSRDWGEVYLSFVNQGIQIT
jgi:hypothetical protein